MFYVYLARCADNSLYTGYCVDLDDREEKHNAGLGAKYTRSRLPIKIVYFEQYDSKSEALKREKEIKSWNRTQKLRLIRDFL